LLAVAAEFAGQLGGRRALADAAENEDELDRRAMRLLKRRAGVGVEDAAAVAAPIIEHGVVAVVVNERIRVPTGGTVQALGMKSVEEKLVAGVGVHEIEDWEVHP